jgi:hypothetical protein
MLIERLRRQFPWPPDRPAVVPERHGWFGPDHERHLGSELGPDTRIVLELGTWLGLSTAFFLQAAPNATILCVDNWTGGYLAHEAEHTERCRRLFETFCVNFWDVRDRIVPVRANMEDGIAAVAAAGIEPDFVYVDGDHASSSVMRDVCDVVGRWPRATVTGDDWKWESVRTALLDIGTRLGVTYDVSGTCWIMRKSSDANDLLRGL